MLSNDEIKDRFYNSGKLIGLDGEYIHQNWDTTYFNPGTIKLLHYKLLDGISDEKLIEELQKVNLSKFEIKFTLKKAHAFITDILGVDLNDHRASQISTGAECQRLLTEKITAANEAFSKLNFAPIKYRDHMFDADEASQLTITGMDVNTVVPEYWVDSNNERVTPWTLEDAMALKDAVIARRVRYHGILTVYKETLRKLTDKAQLDEMKSLTLKFE